MYLGKEIQKENCAQVFLLQGHLETLEEMTSKALALCTVSIYLFMTTTVDALERPGAGCQRLASHKECELEKQPKHDISALSNACWLPRHLRARASYYVEAHPEQAIHQAKAFSGLQIWLTCGKQAWKDVYRLYPCMLTNAELLPRTIYKEVPICCGRPHPNTSPKPSPCKLPFLH